MKFDQHPDFFTDDEPETPEVETSASPDNTTADTDNVSTSPVTDESTTPNKKLRKTFVWLGVIAVIVIAIAFYFRYVSPYATDIKAVGTVYNVERRGLVFKTYECSMATAVALADSVNPYSRTDFSISDQAIAIKLQDAQLNGTQVTITYSRYFGSLPWRGASLNVITAVDPR
jgi:hypothetical protein